MERDIQYGKVSVLEEEILHQQQNYNNLIKEQERLLKDKAEQDQKLQREIHDRLCLKMVNDLLTEESANVKEAFLKLEEFTNSMEQRSKDMSLELDQCRQENLTGNTQQMVNEERWNGDLLLKIASAKSHCEDLKSQLSSLQETNRILNKEKEEKEKQLQLIKMREETLTKQQVSKSKELKTENENLKLTLTMISKKNEEFQKQLEHQTEEMEVLKNRSKELSASVIGSHQSGNIHLLQEEVNKIKENVTRLESEKTELISELNKLHKEQEVWAVQRSELEMTQAELSAENAQLRSELKEVAVKTPENSIANVKKKFELEKEETVKKVKEEMKGSFDEVCLELKTVKSELSKVWDMLEVKEKQLEEQSHELQHEQDQSQKWAEELIQLRKDYADLTANTSIRSQMISTLRDELTQRCEDIIELEAELSYLNQQKSNGTSLVKRKSVELKRRSSDGDINRRSSHSCDSAENCYKECSEVKKMTDKNSHLGQRVEELIAERDSALHDSQELLNGMQQLREAFEEEIERELERERTKFEREKRLLQVVMQSEDDQQMSGTKSKLETEVTRLTAQKVALEVKSKHLEFERDELRNQVEELCRMRTTAEEKAVQVDSALSPRKRETKQRLCERGARVLV
ncbi:hypothetical protein OS493_030000 [Desmophyllum pertusum]|uniref:Uncharacterized protein n=1 Tax=Desmophyllum pertusum TaxID=174260 RepID=A0A9X0D102_9CNID|nr:hypothetical protein OS493_030000 [Desmophyllum pertusum]